MGLLRWFDPVTQPSQSSTLPAELGSASRDKIKLSISSRGCGGPEVKTQKCMHKYYPDMYLILYCMTCFIVLYLTYVIYYACWFEKLLRAYVDCYKMY